MKGEKQSSNAVIAREARTKKAPTIKRLLCSVSTLMAGDCFATLAMTVRGGIFVFSLFQGKKEK
jgi:hypothetical protein